PQPSEAGRADISLPVPVLVQPPRLFQSERAHADQVEVAAQDMQQLGEAIKLQRPQPAPKTVIAPVGAAGPKRKQVDSLRLSCLLLATRPRPPAHVRQTD